jgi:hypothetical protein
MSKVLYPPRDTGSRPRHRQGAKINFPTSSHSQLRFGTRHDTPSDVIRQQGAVIVITAGVYDSYCSNKACGGVDAAVACGTRVRQQPVDR